MTYAAKEASAIEGSPTEFYLFTLGSEVFRYTSQSAPVTVGGFEFTPRPITRTNPKISEEQAGVQLTITLPASDDVPMQYLGIAPAVRMSVTIFRQHRTDTPTPEFITYWKGFVSNVRFRNKQAQMTCEPIQSLSGREIPRHDYGALCGHVLFDTGCKVIKADFSDAVTVDSISASGDELVLDSLSTARPADSTFYTGGYVERANGDRRLILEYTFATDTVRILLPFEGLEVGETVTARAGCAHDVDTCKDKFNNVINYGGFPWVPLTNPFEVGIGKD